MFLRVTRRMTLVVRVLSRLPVFQKNCRTSDVSTHPVKATLLLNLFFPSKLIILEAILHRRRVISTVPPSATPDPATSWCQHADVITRCPPHVSPAIVSEMPCCFCIMCDSLFSHSSPVVTAYRWRMEPASGILHARLECPEDVSGGRGRVFSMSATADSPGTALMYPPASRQYAIHSAVIQSFALARQMVSPLIRLIHCLAPQKVWSIGMIRTVWYVKHHFQAENIDLTVLFVLIVIAIVCKPTPCVGFKSMPKPQ